MKQKKTDKPYTRLNADELRQATAEFDREFIADTFASPDDAARRRHRRAKAKRGRPRRGRGAKAVSVTVEKRLLARTDRLAKKLRISRSRLIEHALRKVLDEVG